MDLLKKKKSIEYQRIYNWIGKHPYLIILAISFIFLAPALIYGMPLDSDDAMPHRRWQHFFANQLWKGEIYPRWIFDMNDGFGSPAFFIYPPLAHSIAALFHPAFPDADGVPYRLAISVFLCLVASGIGAYHWLYQVVQEKSSALIGAVIYVIAPYHLFVDVYLRGAIAELWAFAWAPWTLLAIHLFVNRDRNGIFVFVFSASALIFSHAPSSLFLFFAYFAYAALLAWKLKEVSVLIYSIISTVIAVLIAGVYLGTALSHTTYINSDALFKGYFDFFKWLMFSEARWPSTKAEYAITGVALIQTFAATLLGVISLLGLEKGHKIRYIVWFSLTGNIVIFLLMSTWGTAFWKIFYPLQRIQFPWRLLMLQSVYLGLLAACCATAQNKLKYRVQRKKPLAMLVLILVGFSMVNVSLYGFNKRSLPFTEIGNLETPEYTLGDTKILKHLFQENEKVSFLNGHGKVVIVKWTPRHLLIDIETKTAVRIVIRQFAYPGWQYRFSNLQTYNNVERLDGAEQLIGLSLEAGHKQIEFSLRPTVAESVGIAASILGCLSLIAFILFTPRISLNKSVNEAYFIKKPQLIDN